MPSPTSHPPQAYREIRTHTRGDGERVWAQPTARGKGRELPRVPAGERGPGGRPGGWRRCSPVLGSSPAVGESKVVAGGHFGIFPQPAGHCGGGGERGAAAAGAMRGGPARRGGGERTGHTEEQGRESAGSDSAPQDRPPPAALSRSTDTPSTATHHR